MTPDRQGRVQSGDNAVNIDVDLPYSIHRTNLADMVGDIIKGVLHQRGQIPVNYDKLLQQVTDHQRLKSFDLRNQGIRDVTNLRNSKQEKTVERENTRKKKGDDRFNKKAVIFLDGCEELINSLKQKINNDGNNISSIRLLLGATSVSTKASYTIVFPNSFSEFPIENFRPGRYLFRSMVTNEHIVEINREKLPSTNLFVYVEMREPAKSNSVDKSSNKCRFLPTAEPHEPPGAVGSRRQRFRNVNINIKSKTSVDHVKIGNLFTTPYQPKIASRPFGQDICQPACMELCTPNPTATNNNETLCNANINGKRQRKYSDNYPSTELKKGIRKRHFSIELSTPSTSRCVAVDRLSMDMINVDDDIIYSTGVSTRGRGSMEMCTPSVGLARGRGSMEFCTPYLGVAKGRGSMEICTPIPSYRSLSLTSSQQQQHFNVISNHTTSTRSSSSSMEMCTPGPVSLQSAYSSMELCTPAQQPLVKQRHASMELCTPHIARSSSNGTSCGVSMTTSRIFSECEKKFTELSLTPTTSTRPVVQSTRPVVQSRPAADHQTSTWLKWPVGIKGIPIKL